MSDADPPQERSRLRRATISPLVTLDEPCVQVAGTYVSIRVLYSLFLQPSIRYPLARVLLCLPPR
jgi:hypothetical protein